MRVIRRGCASEMVALFLRSELGSARFGPQVREALGGASERLVIEPNLANRRENLLRARALEAHRGYLSRTGLFNGFPPGVQWYWVALTCAEVMRVRYIGYDYWVQLSGGSRLPRDAAPRIRAGVAPFGVSSAWALALADAISEGVRFPGLILASVSVRGPLVVLEGHARLTAYALRPDELPGETTALLGVSRRMGEWSLY